MNVSMAMPVIVAFGISAVLGPIIIPILRKIKIGQTVREDGPSSHLKKTGTPTMGGILFLISVVITSLLYCREYPDVIPVLFVTLGFGMIGFLDDYIKVVLKRSKGLSALHKLIGQIVVTGIFAYYITEYTQIQLDMKVPFMTDYTIDLGIFNIPFLFIVVLATVNGINFTDGLDGLASSVTIMVATFFSVVAIGTSSGIEPITCAVVGALLGFLLFNVHPASVFMGDTGSLALGGFVATTAYMLQMPLFILIVGFIYVVEMLSVVIQVSYFKLSGGKRIFKMAPIHHHFELCGWSETRIVAVFSIITAILCLVALQAL
ncbi:MAG: phospho-N-acetylmuramoyl-pentapeptide-transferase [Eubacteriales bacterium]